MIRTFLKKKKACKIEFSKYNIWMQCLGENKWRERNQLRASNIWLIGFQQKLHKKNKENYPSKKAKEIRQRSMNILREKTKIVCIRQHSEKNPTFLALWTFRTIGRKKT